MTRRVAKRRQGSVNGYGRVGDSKKGPRRSQTQNGLTRRDAADPQKAEHILSPEPTDRGILVLLVVLSEGSRPNFSRYDSSDGSSIVTEPIPAGGEIFKHYGDEWFYSRPGYSNLTWGFYDIPKALCLLDEFSRRIPNVVQNDLYNTAVIAIRDIWKESRILQALPDDALGNGVFPPLGTSVVVALVVAFSSAAPGC
jgi:hypothetical protein